jgi:hypothetical protein
MALRPHSLSCFLHKDTRRSCGGLEPSSPSALQFEWFGEMAGRFEDGSFGVPPDVAPGAFENDGTPISMCRVPQGD